MALGVHTLGDLIFYIHTKFGEYILIGGGDICPPNRIRRRNSTSGPNFDTCLRVRIFLCVEWQVKNVCESF